MKRFVITIILFICLLSMQGCKNNKDMINNITIGGLTFENITKINVKEMTPPFDDIEIIEPNEITSIANYFNSINPIDTNKDYSGKAGSGYRIDISYGNDVTSKIIIFGSAFTVDDNPTQELSYDEVSAFNVVIGTIIITRYRAENKENIIIGEIVSVSSDKEGHAFSCEIKTNDNKIVMIDINNARILDITGSGGLVLNTGNEVEIGLKNTHDFIADIIFVTKKAN